MVKKTIFSHLQKRVKTFFRNATLFVPFFLLSMALTSCNAQSNNRLAKDPDRPGNSLITIDPDTTKLLRNPLTGWVLYGSAFLPDDFWDKHDSIHVPELPHPVKISDYAHTFYLRVSWTFLNPNEDEYAWDTNEKFKWMVRNARERGMRLAFRVVVDSRDKRQNATPEYVKAAGAKGYETMTRETKVWSPYPDDLVFQKKYEKFLQAFAKEYNDPTVVEFVDGFGLGKWGEAHSMKYLNIANRRKVFEWAIDLYAKYFTKVPLAINYHRLIGTEKDWAEPDPESESMLEYAFDKGYILRHDALGMTDYYQQWERDMAAKWRYVRPIIMEGGWVTRHHNVKLDSRNYSTVADVRKGEFEDSKEAHVNMMDFRINETASWFESCYSLVKKFIAEGGYRLYPQQISLPRKIKEGEFAHIAHTWSNLGWGYCPTNLPQWNQKYKVAFGLLDQNNHLVTTFVDNQTDLSKWLKGNPTSYDFKPQINGISKGSYSWTVAIVDITEHNTKGLDIAVKEEITDSGWLKLCSVEVE